MDNVKHKKSYKGIFNYNGQSMIYYCWAYTKKQAKRLFLNRIAKDTGQILRVIMYKFNDQTDNYRIEEVIK